MALTRNEIVQRSVEHYIRAQVYGERGFSAGDLVWKDSFPGKQASLEKNTVAVGYNFDQEPVQAELGSTLVTRQASIEFFVFGLTNTWAQNIAGVVEAAALRDEFIPLLDFTDADLPETGEVLEVSGARAERQIIQQPEPWQEYVWLTTMHVEDTYDARLV